MAGTSCHHRAFTPIDPDDHLACRFEQAANFLGRGSGHPFEVEAAAKNTLATRDHDRLRTALCLGEFLKEIVQPCWVNRIRTPIIQHDGGNIVCDGKCDRHG